VPPRRPEKAEICLSVWFCLVLRVLSLSQSLSLPPRLIKRVLFKGFECNRQGICVRREGGVARMHPLRGIRIFSWFLVLVYFAVPTLPRVSRPTTAWIDLKLPSLASKQGFAPLLVCRRPKVGVMMSSLKPSDSQEQQRIISMAPTETRTSSGSSLRGGTTSRGIPWTEYLHCEAVVKAANTHQDWEERLLLRKASNSHTSLQESQKAGATREMGRVNELVTQNASWQVIVGAKRWEGILAAQLDDVDFKLRMWKSYARAARNNQVDDAPLHTCTSHHHPNMPFLHMRVV
jgi:hypothetical protein